MPSSEELVATERLKNIQLTGCIDIDALKNLQIMLQRELKNDDQHKVLGIEIYDNDIEKITKFPCIALEVTGGTGPSQRTIGKEKATFEKEIYVTIWFYYADVDTKFVHSEIIRRVSSIVAVLAKNADLNGFCRKGLSVEDYRLQTKAVGDTLVKCAGINIVIPVLYRDRAAGI